MSSRTLILCMLLLFVGCSGTEDDAIDASRETDAGAAPTLEFVPGSTSLLPNGMLELAVALRDVEGRPQVGVLVDFSLVGAAAGASLSPTKVNTDSDGVAKTTLRAGSTASDLQVRARTGANTYVIRDIKVSSAFGTSVSVGVTYDGARKIASYTVTSLPMMSCAVALSSGLAGEATYHFSAPDAQASFDLGYDVSTALVGWGKDDTGSKLARGCIEFRVQPRDTAAASQLPVTLALQDVDLSLSAPLAVEMEINASAAVRHLSEASTRAVAAVVSPNYANFADAEWLLDAVQGALSSQGNVTAATTLATRRAAESLAATLQPALSAKKAGPSAYGEATGEELTRRGASLILRWTVFSALSGAAAQSADGSQTLTLPTLPQATIVTRFAAESAQLSVDTLRVELGLGSYGKALLGSLDATRAAGCQTVFASWWSKSLLTDVVPAADAQAACVAALAKLDGAIEAELLKLDASNATLELAGAVPVHARSEDGSVDDLGPGKIVGNWGADALQAVLQSPQRTAFQ